MQQIIVLSESVANRRRIPFIAVDTTSLQTRISASDMGIGGAGSFAVWLHKTGASVGAATGGVAPNSGISIAEVDSTRKKGEFYLELDATDVNTTRPADGHDLELGRHQGHGAARDRRHGVTVQPVRRRRGRHSRTSDVATSSRLRPDDGRPHARRLRRRRGAGVDWANVKSPTSDARTPTSGTTVSAVSGAVGSVTGNVGGNVTGSVGSVAGSVGGTVASVVGNVGGNVVGSVASVSGNVGGNVSGSVGSVVGGVGGNVAGSVASVAGNVSGSVASVVGAVGSVAGNVVGSVGSVASATSIATAVAAALVEGSHSLGDVMRAVIRLIAAKKSGYSTGTVKIRDLADSKDSMTITVGTDGVTAVTINDLT